jgi:hypothetical protein
MMKLALALAIATAFAAVAAAQDAGIRKEWPDFRYFEPQQVRELPALIKSDLEKRGCKIPRFTMGCEAQRDPGPLPQVRSAGLGGAVPA